MPLTSFDLHKLGWKAFEDLVGCIFREVMGQSFQSFPVGPDGGRDGAFYGQWKTHGGEITSGSYTIQCKHTSKPEKLLSYSIIEEELPKIRRLTTNDLADNYILVTNYTVPAPMEQRARSAFLDAGVQNALVYGSPWVNAQISENPRLRRLVPRLYGLGDLTQIVTHQAYRQAQEVLTSLAPDLSCFVPTESYRKCAFALREYGFVLLLGEPASGKTMIANLLALSAADEWQLQTLILSAPEDLSRLWNPDDPGQFLWADDAFGATQFDLTRTHEWNQRLLLLKTAIASGARAVFTSRDYIYRTASHHLKVSSFELFQNSKVAINVEQLSETERQMILYNHLKCGKQSQQFRNTVKPWLAAAAATPRFLPEIARRFANPQFTRDLSLSSSSVKRFFEEPLEWLVGVIANLPSAEKAAISLVFIHDGGMRIPVPEETNVLSTIATMNSSIGEVKAALKSLEGSFIRRTRERDREYWCFRHPTIRDAFASYVGSNPELIDIYLAGVSTKRLMREVTCGDVNREGVKIVVPVERFSVVLARLREVGREPLGIFDAVGSFLSTRCTVEFLERYFTEVESLESLPKDIIVLDSWNTNLSILCRLHEGGRLPECIRQAAIDRIRKIAMETHGSEFLDEPIVQLLTSQERAELVSELSDIIFSNRNEIIEEIESSWDGEESPDTLFATIIESLGYFEREGNEEEVSLATELLGDINMTIAQMGEYQTVTGEYEALEAEGTRVGDKAVGGSIFDDVDQ